MEHLEDGRAGEAVTSDDSVSGPGGLAGRTHELETLRAALASAVGGAGGLVLLSGEPGIGKTRLAGELAAEATASGTTVLWGRAWEAGGAPSYWPWTQALRGQSYDLSRIADLGPGATALALVVPDVTGGVDADSARSADPTTARFELFEAVTALLRSVSRDRPLLVILDDVHAADTASLLLLQYIAGQLGDASVLLVASYRDRELDRAHPLRAVLADVTRHRSTRRIPLLGLSVGDVADVIRTITGDTPSPTVVAAVHRETDGNPLFVTEVVRLAAAEGRVDEVDPAYWERVVPESVREVIGLRVNRLSRECARALSLASVLGRDVDPGLLQQLGGLDADELADVLDEAAEAGLVTEIPGAPGRLRFSHALVRDVLYDELPPARRSRLHLRAAETLEASGRSSSAQHLTEYAHHLVHAGPNADLDATVAAGRRAAEHAMSSLAYEEAARLLRMALGLLDTAIGDADADVQDVRAELLLALADASARAGDLAEAQARYLAAAALGRRARPHVLARAAMGYGGRFVWTRAGRDPHVIPLLEEALAGLDDQPNELRARLLARLAGASRDDPDLARRDDLSAEAVRVARELGDPATLAYALAGRGAAVMDGPVSRIADPFRPSELIAAATAAGDRELLFEGRLHELLADFHAADMAGANRTLDLLRAGAESLRQPAHLWLVRGFAVSLRLLRGEFAEAEAEIIENERDSRQASLWEAGAFTALHRFILRREQGQLEGVRPILERTIAESPARHIFRCALSLLDVECGELQSARQIIDELVDDAGCHIPLNNDWAASMTFLAEAVSALGLDRQAERLLHDLLPAASTCGDTIEAPLGSLARPVGLLAAAVGDLDAAIDHLSVAAEVNKGLGALPWRARAQAELGLLLLQRSRPGDGERAEESFAGALAIARSIGQGAVEQLVTGVRRRDTAPAVSATARAGTFRREGEYWLIALDGHESRLRDSKGVRHLHRLLSAAGTEVHVLDLSLGASAGRGSTGAAEVGSSTGRDSIGPMLDPQAKAAYKQRILDLQEEIAEAESWNDPRRVEGAQHELDVIVGELAAATGLGGRDRMVGSDAERARVNVTRALRSTIARIIDADPVVGGHLQNAVRTGTFCSYQPDPVSPVRWRL